ncbi:MAG: NAD(P)-dependent oxidoreductase [Rhodospirillales bacterium]|nr:NAD(P)-dependent oxidoreductase [Rhodospirillales bacterium]
MVNNIEKIGFIGLGVLGSAMAGNLIKSGFKLIGYDIDADKLAALVSGGGEAASSPKDVADKADAVILCLPTAEVLAEVTAGADGLIHGGAEGQIVIESSTFAIADKEKARDALASVGKTLLDCPVSGNRILALKKQLTSFGSGDHEAFETIKHVIDGYAHRSFYIGPFGDGMKMKFCGNILNLVHNSAAAEVMVLGMKAGLDPKIIHQVISGSGSSSSMFEVRGALMVENDYDKEGMNFSIPLKDSRLISDHAARHLCPIPIYQAALQPYYAAVAQGHHDEDPSSVCAALELAANCVRKKPD